MLVVGAVFLELKRRGVNWFPALLYGFTGCVLTGVLIYTLTGRPILSLRQPETTLENVGQNIKAWSDSLELPIQRQTNPSCHFVYNITLKSGNIISVCRPKERDHYVQFESQILISKEEQAMVDKLSKDEIEDAKERLVLDLTRSHTSFMLVPPFNLTIIKIVAITNSFTEDTLRSSLDEVDAGLNIARASVIIRVLSRARART